MRAQLVSLHTSQTVRYEEMLRHQRFVSMAIEPSGNGVEASAQNMETSEIVLEEFDAKPVTEEMRCAVTTPSAQETAELASHRQLCARFLGDDAEESSSETSGADDEPAGEAAAWELCETLDANGDCMLSQLMQETYSKVQRTPAHS